MYKIIKGIIRFIICYILFRVKYENLEVLENRNILREESKKMINYIYEFGV